jgi:DNA-binding transcriptional regulator WhiA
VKKISLIVVIIATAFIKNTYSQDSTNQSQVTELLSLYYNIKDALVASNGSMAATYAGAFVKITDGLDSKVMSEGSIQTLGKHARRISETRDLKKQREYFASLSATMIEVAKTVKLSDKPIYHAYCPMKKTPWLSNEKAIKNPYYGSAMLTCGEVKETIQ